ncbi:MAG TPA: hypothetical protein VF264_05450 [Rhodanobacteraceae bacterium]
MDRPNRALFFWGKDVLDRGDRAVIGAYLQDLSKRLRDEPTQEECEAAAEVCERIASKGAGAWAACGFVANHRPSIFGRDYEIWTAVRELVDFHNATRAQAYARVATKHGISASRVKAIFLRRERAWQRACARDHKVTQEQLDKMMQERIEK